MSSTGPGVQRAREVMGLSASATLKDLQHAFRELSKTAHPDVAGTGEAVQDRYREILESYRLLKTVLKQASQEPEPVLHPHPRQRPLFEEEKAAPAPAPRPGGPRLAPGLALENLRASRNPHLRVFSARALQNRLTRPLGLELLRLLREEQNQEVCHALVQTLQTSDVALVQVGLRLYLARQAGFRLRRDFAGLLKGWGQKPWVFGRQKG